MAFLSKVVIPSRGHKSCGRPMKAAHEDNDNGNNDYDDDGFDSDDVNDEDYHDDYED
ncbi:hypothetical protein PtrM4_032670 [Pyrenophora tritici-repentis]|uniref:Uncharacterized protein n=2 Tax=Pyrenophora tritici-repentis TaxID=45151 RepID=A0A834SBA8_9PLEO|nr:uncharacterized protein PTRG_08806 [Pyrenophora tritici-repentis Pt-1C-BFP]EDU41857.1 predicted protein [Pyrenophora tritici-repentis Pt-1C-BFP]KAF7579027.1 hypothetical protein PtrM4_032670 [Pyrenophora tritici-repentis]KAI1512901.1 hypothetical protein Ptr86124_007921 [Pyrenophora tritici-repentis]KAI1689858.1 hypothetical protein KJE20_03036 [Pyrenophora tritici-repentis]